MRPTELQRPAPVEPPPYEYVGAAKDDAEPDEYDQALPLPVTETLPPTETLVPAYAVEVSVMIAAAMIVLNVFFIVLFPFVGCVLVFVVYRIYLWSVFVAI